MDGFMLTSMPVQVKFFVAAGRISDETNKIRNV
jgi:hypothetical protein